MVLKAANKMRGLYGFSRPTRGQRMVTTWLVVRRRVTIVHSDKDRQSRMAEHDNVHAFELTDVCKAWINLSLIPTKPVILQPIPVSFLDQYTQNLNDLFSRLFGQLVFLTEPYYQTDQGSSNFLSDTWKASF